MPIKHIRWTVHLLVSITFISLLSGCLGLNDVKPLGLSFQGTPPTGRAYAIVALSVEAPQKQPLGHAFSIWIEEYSIERQDITGNCWRNNLMYPSVQPFGGTRQYFAFDVKPGYYAAIGYLGTMHKQLAFEVPAGRIVYLGEFILTSDGGQRLNRDLSAVRDSFPGRDVLLAETRQVSEPHGIMCGF